MSYCRFSTDNFNSDVYVYEASTGYTVHIAENRYVFDRDKLPKVNWNTSTPEEIFEHNKLLSEMVANAERVKIGLPYDGKTFTFPTAVEIYIFLEKIQKMGYLVPDSCFNKFLDELFYVTVVTPQKGVIFKCGKENSND